MEVALFVIAITTAIFGVGSDYFRIKDSLAQNKQVNQQVKQEHGAYCGQLPQLGQTTAPAKQAAPVYRQPVQPVYPTVTGAYVNR